MDPITTIIVSSAVGGAAGGFVKELATNGVSWLVNLLSAQSPEVQAKVKENTERFLERLAKRVERLEYELPNEQRGVFVEALKHPSSSFLIAEAVREAAVTDSDERHELLSELIAQRLNSGADDMIALAGQTACSIVNSLTTRQIRILAMLAMLEVIRPLKRMKFATDENAKSFAKDYWNSNLSILIADSEIEKISRIDLDHLVALGCIRVSIGSKSLNTILAHGITDNNIQFDQKEFDGVTWYQVLQNKFKDPHGANLSNCTLTTTGTLIGILRKDAKLGTKTAINW